MRTFLAIYLFVLLGLQQGFAQDKVVLTSGTSLNGLIRQVWNEYIAFLPAGASKEIRLHSDTIDHCARTDAGNKRVDYYAKVLYLGDGSRVPYLVRLTRDGRIREFTLNEATFGFAYNGNNINRYFLEKDASGIVYIGCSSGLVGIRPEPVTARTIVQRVAELLSDNPALCARYQADPRNFKLKTIHSYIRAYNQNGQVSAR